MAPLPNDPLDVALGARLRLIRLLRGQSQDSLARAAGVTFQQMQKYESGVNRVSASTLSRIAAALETPVSAFFGEGSVTAPRVDEAAEVLGQAGALDLLRAWAALGSEATKRRLVELLESLSPEAID